jgi:predicted RNase H-like nuclease
MVRLLGLKQIVKYKRGLVAERRSEFARLQRCLVTLVAREFSFLTIGEEARGLLAAQWSKPVEDRIDAFFCALIGLWHVRHLGRCSEVIGDLESGFILLPADRPGTPLGSPI